MRILQLTPANDLSCFINILNPDFTPFEGCDLTLALDSDWMFYSDKKQEIEKIKRYANKFNAFGEPFFKVHVNGIVYHNDGATMYITVYNEDDYNKKNRIYDKHNFMKLLKKDASFLKELIKKEMIDQKQGSIG